METAKVQNYNLISFTDKGAELMKKIAEGLCDSIKAEDEHTGDDFEGRPIFSACSDLKSWTKDCFASGNVLIFVGAMGIAVRAIAPFVEDKKTDPAVIVIDEGGRFVIPVLSGHIGGAVKNAQRIAQLINGEAVITTATDVEGLFAVDVFASENNLRISDMKKAKEFSAKLLKTKEATFYIDEKCKSMFKDVSLPKELKEAESLDKNPDMIISPFEGDEDTLRLIPKCVIVGIGCKKGTDIQKLEDFYFRKLVEAKIDPYSVKAIASIDLKENEPALVELTKKQGTCFLTFSADELMEQKGDFSSSSFVKEITGCDNVCERAVIAAGANEIIVKKTSEDGMTFALGI